MATPSGGSDARMREIQDRKEDHLRLHFDSDVLASRNPWDAVHVPHNALPDQDLASIRLETSFLGRALKAPICFVGMTGGAPLAGTLNDRLAAVAAELGLAMGVGSQRAAIEHPELRSSYVGLRDHDVPLRMGNLGLSQCILYGDKLEDALHSAIEMIDAHVLAIHLNPLQEAIQPEGEPLGKGWRTALQRVLDLSPVPVLIKETGAGIDAEAATQLVELGVAGIDVGGLGGTTFSAVEGQRAKEAGLESQAALGELFRNWGNPTPDALAAIRAAHPDLPLIATGGLRHGLDALRAIHLGADLAGFAGAAIRHAHESEAELRTHTLEWLQALKIGLFLSRTQYPARRGDVGS